MQLKTLQTRLETSSIDEVQAVLDRKVDKMSKNITIDVYFTVICDTCHNVLKATYDDRNHTVDVEPCKECIESYCVVLS